MSEIAKQGFKTVICNRPDGEEIGQPDFEAIADRARAAGMEPVYIPVNSMTMGPGPARQFAETIEKSDGPVFAYCRTGTRCATLWTIAGMMDHQSKQELWHATANAGYDMSQLLANYGG